MKTIQLSVIQLTALQVAVDSGIEATDLLTSSKVKEDVKMGKAALALLREVKALLASEPEVLEVPEKWVGPLYYEVDCLLDTQRELLEDEDADVSELEERITALEYLLGTLS
jgi:hypothetical protein